METNRISAIVIARHHPELNFGQTVTFEFGAGGASIPVIPDGEKKEVLVFLNEIWPCSRTTEYQKYNAAIANMENIFNYGKV